MNPPALPSWPDAPAVSNTPRRGSWFARRLLMALLPQRIPFACLVLMAANLAAFLGEEQWGGSAFFVTLKRMGAGYGPAALGVEAWRLLTAGYLHLSWEHLVGNLVLLLLCGMYLEGLLGPSRVVLLYTLSILASTLVAAGLLPEMIVVGASGGVCGLMGALLALASRPRAPLSSGRRLVYVLAATVTAISIVHATCACGQMISNVMHLAGGAVGLVLGMSGVLLWRLPGPWDVESPWVRASALAAAYGTLFCMGCALGRERPWEVREAQPLVRLEMPGTPVSVAVPIGAASRAEVLEDASDGGSSARVFFGDVMTDPLTVEVTVEQLVEAVPEERLKEDTRALRQTLYEEAEGPQPTGVSMGSMPRMDEVDGRPAVYSSRRVGSLFRAARWAMYREDWLITIEVWRAHSGLPESWERQVMDVVRSVVVRKEGAPPWDSCAAWNPGRPGACPFGP